MLAACSRHAVAGNGSLPAHERSAVLGARRMTAAHKEAIAIIEQSVPVLASSLRPADTFDSSILSHIMATVPKIEHPDPNKKKLPKDLDVLALLQDGAHFDVRSWRGVLPRRTAYDDLLSLLHFHLVLPLAFPLLVLYLGGHGQEYIVDSEKTLKAAISDALTRRDRSGRSQIVFAVRRSPRPLFHTAAREEAALRLQSAWRMLRVCGMWWGCQEGNLVVRACSSYRERARQSGSGAHATRSDAREVRDPTAILTLGARDAARPGGASSRRGSALSTDLSSWAGIK